MTTEQAHCKHESQEEYFNKDTAKYKYEVERGSCPHCGYCPCCGRRNWPNRPYYGDPIWLYDQQMAPSYNSTSTGYMSYH